MGRALATGDWRLAEADCDAVHPAMLSGQCLEPAPPLIVSPVPRVQHGDQHRPQQRAGEHRQPAQPGGDGLADDAVDPEHHELVQRQQHEHRERLVIDREDAHAQLELVREESDQQKCQRVLAEDGAFQHVDGESAQPGEHQARRCAARSATSRSRAAAADAGRAGSQRLGQRHDGEDQRQDHRDVMRRPLARPSPVP